VKAIFIHKNCILRDSHIDPAAPEDGWRLTPATLEALRRLSGPEQMLVAFDAASPALVSEDRLTATQNELVRQVEAGGGRLDALINCPHADTTTCRCWGSYPGVLWLPAAQLNLDLTACFVIADQERDITTAYASGVRPLMILENRQIVDVVGPAPSHKDFPIAPDLTSAANYIAVEQEIALSLGHQRNAPLPVPSITELDAQTLTLPSMSVTSQRLKTLLNRQQEVKIKLKDLARWLSFFLIGAIGVTLGIAYLLTHLYREQPFPEFVDWVTLQFIPRPLRGALFIVLGIGIIWLAVRSFIHSELYARFQRFTRRVRGSR
jgi:D-glycero-D-manno-heptose 1,7-bisphosphate phosphatase